MCAVKQKRLATFSLARGRPHIQELFEEALLNPLTGSSHSAWVRGVHELLLMAFLAYSAAFAYNSGSSWAVALSMYALALSPYINAVLTAYLFEGI